MDSKPLAYESLKTVIQYMDANLRFMIIHRMPSIRKAEKATPLKIDRLAFLNSNQFRINGICYSLSVYCMYPANRMSEFHWKRKMSGLLFDDLDQFGIRDYSADDVILPGDVIINDGSPRQPSAQYQTEEYYMRRLRAHEEDLQKIRRPDLVPQDDPAILKHVERLNRRQEAVLRLSIQNLKLELEPFLNRRQNRPAAFAKWYQFNTGYNAKRPLAIIRPGTIRMHEVQKNILNFYFGGRRTPPFVKQFYVTGHYTLRLPPNFKLKIEKLSLYENPSQICTGIQDIIHESSLPLPVIEAFSNKHLDHILIRSALKLIVRIENTQDWLPNFLALPNREIHVANGPSDGDNNCYVDLIKNWIEIQKVVGSRATFAIFMKNPESILTVIKQSFEIKEEGFRFVKMPMNHFSEVHVLYGNGQDGGESYGYKWILSIEIVKV